MVKPSLTVSQLPNAWVQGTHTDDVSSSDVSRCACCHPIATSPLHKRALLSSDEIMLIKGDHLLHTKQEQHMRLAVALGHARDITRQPPGLCKHMLMHLQHKQRSKKQLCPPVCWCTSHTQTTKHTSTYVNHEQETRCNVKGILVPHAFVVQLHNKVPSCLPPIPTRLVRLTTPHACLGGSAATE